MTSNPKIAYLGVQAIEQYEASCDKLVKSFFSYESNSTDLPIEERRETVADLESLLEATRANFNKLPGELQVKLGDGYLKLFDRVKTKLEKESEDIGSDES